MVVKPRQLHVIAKPRKIVNRFPGFLLADESELIMVGLQRRDFELGDKRWRSAQMQSSVQRQIYSWHLSGPSLSAPKT